MAYSNNGRILIHATVSSIRDDQILYPSCTQCYSKMQHEEYDKDWFCFKCGIACDESKVVWRYRLSITVADKHSLTDLAVFGKTLEPFFGTTALRLHRFIEDIDGENMLEENLIRAALEDTFLGQSFLFGIKSNARLTPLQKYHGPSSPVALSTLSKMKLGNWDSLTQKSDVVAVQVLSSANVSFSDNTVLHNLQKYSNRGYIEEGTRRKSVSANSVNVSECSYLPFNTTGKSFNLTNGSCSSVELSYEKSIEGENKTTLNENYSTNSSDIQNNIQRCNDQSNMSSNILELSTGHQRSVSEVRTIKTVSDDINVSKSEILNDSQVKSQMKKSTISYEKDEKMTCGFRSNDFSSGNNFNSLHFEKARAEETVKSFYEHEYLVNSEWDNSFNFTHSLPKEDIEFQRNIISAIEHKVCCLVTVTDPPESEHLTQFIQHYPIPTFKDTSISVMLPSLSECPTNSTVFSKHAGVDFNQVQNCLINKERENLCDMLESEDLQAFLDSDSFDYTVVTCDIANDSSRIICDRKSDSQEKIGKLNNLPESTNIQKVLDFDRKSDQKDVHQFSNFNNCSQTAIAHPNYSKCFETDIQTPCIELANTNFIEGPYMPESEDLGVFLNSCSFDYAEVTEYQHLDDSTKCMKNVASGATSPSKLHCECADPKISISKSFTENSKYKQFLPDNDINCDTKSPSVPSSQLLLDQDSAKAKCPVIQKIPTECSNCSFNHHLFGANISESSQAKSHQCNTSLDAAFEESLCLFSEDENIANQSNLSMKFQSNQSNICNTSVTCAVIPYHNIPDMYSNLILTISSPNTAVASMEQNCYQSDLNTNVSTSNSLVHDSVLSVEVLRDAGGSSITCGFDPVILSESLFSQSFTCPDSQVTEYVCNVETYNNNDDSLTGSNNDFHTSFAAINNEGLEQFGTSLEDEELIAVDYGSSGIGNRLDLKSPNIHINGVCSNDNKIHEQNVFESYVRKSPETDQDGSLDLFESSTTKEETPDKSAHNPELHTIGNSILEHSDSFPFCLKTETTFVVKNKKVHFARRLSSVRNLRLLDIRLNLCKTSSPFTNTQKLKSCLRNTDEGEHDTTVLSQDLFSPSPIRRTSISKTIFPKEDHLNPKYNNIIHHFLSPNSLGLLSSEDYPVDSPDLFSSF